MADAIRAVLAAARLGRRRRGRPGPVRRQRHLGQHRRVPGRAVDRRRARRRRLAQARRDGRDRGPGRADRRGPRRGRVTGARAGPTRRPDGRPGRRARRPRPIVLVVLDGFGIGGDPAADAIAAAPMPTWRGLLRDWPHAVLGASEEAVGLPPGQMGNSEVGHLNLGAGRPVLQDLPRIDAAIADGSFFDRPALLAACRRAARPGGRLHLISLIGPGGVHANDRHLVALAELAARRGVPRVRVHALLDGRDTPPRSALGFVADLERRLAAAHPDARIATVGGRYYAMDRDGRWDRVERGYDAIVHGVGEPRRERDGRDRGRLRRAARTTNSSPRRSSTASTGRSAAATRDPRQLPGRSGAPADPRPGRLESSSAFDRASPDGRPAPTDLLRGDDDRVRGRAPGRGRVPARGGALARAGLLRGRLAPVPRRRDREVRARHVLLQRRRRGALSRARNGVLIPSPRVATYDLEPGDERRRRHRRAGRGDRLGALRLHRRQLRQPGHGRPHRRVGRDDRRARGHRRLSRPGRRGDRGRRRRRSRRARERSWRSPPTTATPTSCATPTATRSRPTRSTRCRSCSSVARRAAWPSRTASWPTSRRPSWTSPGCRRWAGMTGRSLIL